jgi:hypothetical protein
MEAVSLFRMVGDERIELPLDGSEPPVLPLDQSPISGPGIQIRTVIHGFICASNMLLQKSAVLPLDDTRIKLLTTISTYYYVWYLAKESHLILCPCQLCFQRRSKTASRDYFELRGIIYSLLGGADRTRTDNLFPAEETLPH